MKERPILFSAPMIRAILEGRKTMTRRIITPQPLPKGIDSYAWKDGLFALDRYPAHTTLLEHCPYGRPGDRLWVRETRAKNYPAVYRADVVEDFYTSYLWTPSIHMPRHASRITLEVTGVRVERVQDITEAEAESEGIFRLDYKGFRTYQNYALSDEEAACSPMLNSAVDSFISLWDSLYPEYKDAWKRWDANPFVWCIEFKRVQL